MDGDTLASAKWYYFDGAAGTHMATTNPGRWAGGTKNTGWLSTPHPAMGDPQTEGLVCFTVDGTPDRYSNTACRYSGMNSVNIYMCTCSYDEGATVRYLYKLPAAEATGEAAYSGSDTVLVAPPPLSPALPTTVGAGSPPASPSGYCHPSCPQSLSASTALFEAWRNVRYAARELQNAHASHVLPPAPPAPMPTCTPLHARQLSSACTV